MTVAATQSQLPVYTLDRASRSGTGLFEISRVCGLTEKQRQLFFVPHYKDFYLLVWIKAGNTRHWVDGVPYSARPDALYFSSPEQIYLKEDGIAQSTGIAFSREFLDLEDTGLLSKLPIIQNPFGRHELPLSPEDLVFLDDIAQKLLDEQEQNHGMRNSMISAYLRVLLIHLSRIYTTSFATSAIPEESPLLTRFRSLINEHYTRHHDVAAYADMLSVSTGHFSELVKKQSGKTPMEHIHDRLLLEAKRLLFHTEASAKEIAFELGFEEASYFNRFFRRLTDSTPLSYRAATREKYH
jgi:AraC-like DNA-binding protein